MPLLAELLHDYQLSYLSLGPSKRGLFSFGQVGGLHLFIQGNFVQELQISVYVV